METAQYLQRLWPFSELDPQHLSAIADHVRPRRYAPGRYLFQENDPVHSLFVMVQGAVHLQRTFENGLTCHLARYLPGELVDEGALPNHQPRTADAVAIGPCELLVVDGGAFDRCFDRCPQFSRRFLHEVLARQQRRMGERALFEARPVVERVAVTILELMDVYGKPEPSGARRLDVQVTQEEIAQWVGVQRESVNRTLSSFKRQGAIRVEGRQLVVLNELRLRILCGAGSGSPRRPGDGERDWRSGLSGTPSVRS